MPGYLLLMDKSGKFIIATDVLLAHENLWHGVYGPANFLCNVRFSNVFLNHVYPLKL